MGSHGHNEEGYSKLAQTGKWSITEHFSHSGIWDFTTIDGPKGQFISLGHVYLPREQILILAKQIIGSIK